MSELSVADVLNRAADLIEPEGAWTQQRAGMPFPRSSQCPTCAGFAIDQSAKGGGIETALAAFYQVIPASDIAGLIRWNDAPERTQAEVVAKLREAARLASVSSS